jgi:hypothetical protein
MVFLLSICLSVADFRGICTLFSQGTGTIAAATQTAVKEPWEYYRKCPESAHFMFDTKKGCFSHSRPGITTGNPQKVPEKLPKMIKNKCYLVDSNTRRKPSPIPSPNQPRFAHRG